MKIELTLNSLKKNLAAWLTGAALVLFGGTMTVFTGMVFSGAGQATRTAAQADRPDSERTYLLRQKIWLMARINLCEQEKQGQIPARSSVCPPAEQARLPEYKQRILEIDRQIQGP